LILENISKGQPAYNEETFAPVFSLFTFKDEMEAIRLANDCSYGLSGTVISNNIERAKSVALKLEVGNVYINESVASDPAIPSGGIKDSGYGRECYKDGLLEIINRKAICVTKPKFH
jgi:succinate-semialdehyde dehydrogenase/glutarate-semialdehyde dehydrogenase